MNSLLTTTLDPSRVSATMTKLAENTTGSSTLSEGSVIVGVVVELVILILITGNLLMVVTLLLYKPWTIPDLLLFSLSLADLINGMIPANILNIINSFYGQERWTPGLCTLFIWMTFSLRMTSVCTITLISGERMLMLTKPLRHHSIMTVNKVRIAIGIVWVFSMFLSTIPFMAGQSGFSNGFCYYQLYDLGLGFGITIEAIGIIQLILVLACFIIIKFSSFKFIKRQSIMAASNQTGNKVQRKDKETAGTKQVRQLYKMMAIVVILYYVSWLPYLLTNFVSLVYGHLPHTVDIIVGFLSLVSAIINPLLYGKMSLRYWRGYLFIFRKIRSLCGGEKPDGSFFNDRRRGSYSAAYSHPIRLDGRLSTAELDVRHQINPAYEDEEKNDYKKEAIDDVTTPANNDDDDKDDDDDEIAIYPVEVNKVDNDDDDDENNETQITICPLNQSAQFNDGSNEPTGSEDKESEEKPSTVDEEDFSICPYDESIIAHYEDLIKLAEEQAKISENDSHNAPEPAPGVNPSEHSTLENGQSNVKSDEDINILGSVLDTDGNDTDESNRSQPKPQINNQGVNNEGKSSQSESDASDSFGEGSILGNYDITMPSAHDSSDDNDQVRDSDASSRGSAEGNYDIMEDLLEDQNAKNEKHGHFFVDDVVKKMEEEEKQQSSMETFDFLSDNNKLLEENHSLDDALAKPSTTKSTQDVDRAEKGTMNGEQEGEPDERRNDTEDGIDSESEDENDKRNGNKVIENIGKEESKNEGIEMVAPVKENEKEDKEKNEKEMETSNTEQLDIDKQREEKSEEAQEATNGEAQNEDSKKRIQQQLEETPDEINKGAPVDRQQEEHNNNIQDDEQEDDDEEEPNFIAKESIFKGSKTDFSAKKKYFRKESDLLRKELGEI